MFKLHSVLLGEDLEEGVGLVFNSKTLESFRTIGMTMNLNLWQGVHSMELVLWPISSS